MLTAGSMLVATFVIVNSLFYSPEDEVSLPTSLKKSLASEVPRDATTFPERLKIPSILVDATVQDVGITRKGNMSTPSNFTDVGWFKYGTVPGEMGSAVIAGHVDNGLALPGVFANLDKIKVGDDIYVETAGGKKIQFKVTSKKLYEYTDKTDEVFNENDGSYLKLITCAGVWLPENRTHDQRLVVTAIKIP